MTNRNPGPSYPDPFNSGSFNSDPSQPGPSSGGLFKPRPSQPGSFGSSPSQPGPAHPGSAYPGPSQPGPARPGPSYPGPAYPGPSRPGPSYPGLARPGSSQPGSFNASPSYPGISHSSPSYPGPSSHGPSNSGPSKKRTRRVPIPMLFISALLVGLVVSVGIFYVWQHPFSGQSGKQTASVKSPTPPTRIRIYTPPPIAGSPSPYIFGANFTLPDGNSQISATDPTWSNLQFMHVRIVRVILRPGLPTNTLLQAAQAIKGINAVPLLALEGMQQPSTAQADDLQAVKVMNQVFGKNTVYYEFGNEDDNNGVSITQYTNGWNTIIPQLKKAALQGSFVGPVSYQYNHDAVNAFLQNARPRPDAVSWHEYTCAPSSSQATCLANIAAWSTHINDARSAMLTQLNTTLPVMITSWNYTSQLSLQADGTANNDGKDMDTAFVTSWTTQAIHTLINNHVFASMQYAATGTTLPLIAKDNTTLTTMGTTFQSLYLQLIAREDFNG